MSQTPPRSRPSPCWAIVAAWTLAIFAAVPFAREVQRRMDAEFGAGSLRTLSIALVMAAAAIAALQTVRAARWRLPLNRLLPLAGVALLFLFAIRGLTDKPAEAVHFIQYGVLSVLAYAAFARRRRDRLAHMNAVLYCALASLVDEVVQWLLPGRYWDIRDVRNNIGAAVLAQTGILAGFRLPVPPSPPSPRSVRIAARLAAVFAIALALCYSNTPASNARVAGVMPRLAFLLDQDHAMAEFGFRHVEPGIGRFYSRFSLASLAELDAARGPEVGAILRHYSTADSYTNFLRRFTPARDPYTHEAMVRYFRRNHYLGVLPKHRFDPDEYRRHLTVAFRENQILERYYSNTLAHTGSAWTDELKEALAGNLSTRRYTSEVGEHIIHRVALRHLWLAAILAVAGLLAIERRWGRGEDRP